MTKPPPNTFPMPFGGAAPPPPLRPHPRPPAHATPDLASNAFTPGLSPSSVRMPMDGQGREVNRGDVHYSGSGVRSPQAQAPHTFSHQQPPPYSPQQTTHQYQHSIAPTYQQPPQGRPPPAPLHATLSVAGGSASYAQTGPSSSLAHRPGTSSHSGVPSPPAQVSRTSSQQQQPSPLRSSQQTTRQQSSAHKYQSPQGSAVGDAFYAQVDPSSSQAHPPGTYSYSGVPSPPAQVSHTSSQQQQPPPPGSSQQTTHQQFSAHTYPSPQGSLPPAPAHATPSAIGGTLGDPSLSLSPGNPPRTQLPYTSHQQPSPPHPSQWATNQQSIAPTYRPPPQEGSPPSARARATPNAFGSTFGAPADPSLSPAPNNPPRTRASYASQRQPSHSSQQTTHQDSSTHTHQAPQQRRPAHPPFPMPNDAPAPASSSNVAPQPPYDIIQMPEGPPRPPVDSDSSSDSEDVQSDDNAQGQGRGPQRGNDVGSPGPAQRPAHPNYDYRRAPALDDDSSSDSEDYQSDHNAQGQGQGRGWGSQRGNDVGGPDPAQRPAHPNYDYGRAPAPEAGRVQVPPQAGRAQVPPQAGRAQVPPQAGRAQVVQIPQATVLCGFCRRMTPSEKVRRLGGCCCGCCAQHRRESGHLTSAFARLTTE